MSRDATPTGRRGRQKTPAVIIPDRRSMAPLHLLIDGTGIEVEGKGEWQARGHGGPKWRVWCWIHLGIDEQTMGMRAVEIIGSRTGDASVVADPRDQITADRKIGSVTADGAHDTRKCHDATAERASSATPGRGTRKLARSLTFGRSPTPSALLSPITRPGALPISTKRPSATQPDPGFKTVARGDHPKTPDVRTLRPDRPSGVKTLTKERCVTSTASSFLRVSTHGPADC